MELASVRIITDDFDDMVGLYELVTGIGAQRPAPVFAELVTPLATLAIGHSSTVPLFGEGAAEACANRTAIIELRVDDVDAEHKRLQGQVDSWVQAPTDMPWGNRSALLRDPDGNLGNLFSPTSEEVRARFAGRSTSTGS
ncbi:VOC family protein [Brachybacterium saurashtrense]|uniref:VOC family protein n=1 Tax=Brachybacterium saurashtrense TaxID=556288 RepID=A0A345YRS4_9MICO|nr:VOC family protein [Brachybacterium saurashtrense]AXK46626.1 VOC family protein [Brachybacterium saurashtrense]RRR20771.1 VOC family protein [Brachybacterium saurashtrense]